MSVDVGSVLEGVVTGITGFGAFVKLPNGKTGLVHISEVSDSYVEDINTHLKKDDTVKVKVLTVREGGEKIGLSIRQASETAGAGRAPAGRGGPRPSGPRPGGRGGRPPRGGRPSGDFEDVLARFIKDSDQKHKDLKRSTDSKRGGRGASRSF